MSHISHIGHSCYQSRLNYRSSTRLVASPLPRLSSHHHEETWRFTPRLSTWFHERSTYCALQIGVILSSVLFGMTTLQVYMYFERFLQDRLSIKLLVVFVWLVETAHAACLSHVLYSYSIIDYGNPASLLLKPPVTLDIGILLSGFIVVSVQQFFAYRIYILSNNRIYILSNNRPIAICFAILSLVWFAGAFALFVGGVQATSLPQYLDKWGTVAILVLSLSAATDLVIALTLVILLRRDREKWFKKTNVIINQLITWTIETGLLTSVSGIATAVALQTMKTNLIWMALFAIRSQLFANSFLAGLNSRTALRAAHQNQTHTSMFPSHPSLLPVSATPSLGGDADGHPQIEVNLL